MTGGKATAPVWGEASTLGGPPDGAGSGWRVRLGQWLADPPFQAVSMTCTFYALFLPDVCTGFLAPGADTAIMSVGLAIVFFFFIAEGILMVTVRPSYMFTLFFALDVVATVSLVFVRSVPAPVMRLPLSRRRPLAHVAGRTLARRTSLGLPI